MVLHCMNPKPSLYYDMQSSMHWLVLYGVALYESKALQSSMHCMVLQSCMVLHCMNPKPSLYMQSSMHWLVLYGVALYESKTFTIHVEFYALASPVWCCIV